MGLGEGAVRAAIGGTDDLGQALRVDQGGPILVEYAEVDGAEAPPAPVIVRALDAGAAGPDVIEGTVEGTPDTTVTVSLATSPVGGDETCSQLMAGDGVTGLGSFPVTIDAEGVGRFTRDGPLEPGTHVYGITAVRPVGVRRGRVHPRRRGDPERAASTTRRSRKGAARAAGRR